jgi:hypothetical protein
LCYWDDRYRSIEEYEDGILIEEDLVDTTTLSPEEAEKVRHVRRSKRLKEKKFSFTNNQIDNLLGLLAVSGVLLGGALYSLIDRYGFDSVVTSFFELVSVRLDFSEIVTKLKPFCEVMGWQEYFDNYFSDRLSLNQADYVGEQIREFSGGRYVEPIGNRLNADLIHNLPSQPLRHDPIQVNAELIHNLPTQPLRHDPIQVNAELIHNLPTQPLRHDPIQVNAELIHNLPTQPLQYNPIEVLQVNTELISVNVEPIEVIQLNVEPIEVIQLNVEPIEVIQLNADEFDNHEAHKIKLQKQVSSSEWCTTIKKFTN